MSVKNVILAIKASTGRFTVETFEQPMGEGLADPNAPSVQISSLLEHKKAALQLWHASEDCFQDGEKSESSKTTIKQGYIYISLGKQHYARRLTCT